MAAAVTDGDASTDADRLGEALQEGATLRVGDAAGEALGESDADHVAVADGVLAAVAEALACAE